MFTAIDIYVEPIRFDERSGKYESRVAAVEAWGDNRRIIQGAMVQETTPSDALHERDRVAGEFSDRYDVDPIYLATA